MLASGLPLGAAFPSTQSVRPLVQAEKLTEMLLLVRPRFAA